MAQRKEALQKVEDINIGEIVVSTATNVVKKRPVTVSLWVLGLLLAAFANGFSVDDTTRASYSMTLEHAEEVDRQELGKALGNLRKAEERHYNAKGWFWSCDERCQKAKDKMEMAQANVARVQKKRDSILNEARREVGIWSVFGVRDVRNSFWSAWQSGKDWAARWTMYDAFFMMMPGRKEESFLQVILQLVFQYLVNLTMGLIGAFFFFVYNVYSLICAYGEPALSGVAFFLLVVVAGIATVGTYLGAIFGGVAGGGLFLVKQAAKQAALEGNAGGRQRPRHMQDGAPPGHGHYGGGRVGGSRQHFD